MTPLVPQSGTGADFKNGFTIWLDLPETGDSMEINHQYFVQSYEDFKRHLLLPNNERILFSAKYGMGKTTFLKEFFKDEKQKELLEKKKFNVIHLYPVNYSVSSNADIFRLLKYDIIYWMMENDIEFKKEDFSYLQDLPKFVKKNIHKIIAPLLLFLPVVGKETFTFFKELDQLKDEFLKGCEEKKKGEEKLFEDFLVNEMVNEASIYENDVITALIENVLTRLKKDGEENVLILDDLDRLDPAHIFRLFNVFAAHIDLRETSKKKNKFGFDKVIFVCDIDNIRDLFHHSYGNKLNFSGYIDKFYSFDVFTFNNRQSYISTLRNLLGSIKFTLSNQSLIDLYYKTVYANRDIEFILDKFIKVNAISFRSLIRYYDERHAPVTRNIKFSGEIKYYNWQIPFILQLEFLISIFGHYLNLLEAVEKCIERKIIDNDLLRPFGPILILDNARHGFRTNGSPTPSNHFSYNGYSYNYNILNDNTFTVNPNAIDFTHEKNGVSVPKLNDNCFFPLMRDSILYLNGIGYFQ